MSARLDRRLAALRDEKRGGLALFTIAGDPDQKTALAIVSGLPAAGADIIELGMPFSDPMADGPVIQQAGLRALAAGGSMRQTLDLVRAFRETDDDTPIVLMGYYNPVYAYGIDKFVRDAAAAGVDALIVVDLPPEEDDELRLPAREAGIALIRLFAPTTDDARLGRIAPDAAGFVYYVAIAGVTGGSSATAADLEAALSRIRRATALPVAVGFGIKTPAQALEVASIADIAVVGSAFVQRIADNLDADGKAAPGLVEHVLGFAGELGHAVRGSAAVRRGRRENETT